jgi:hypothetical protein
MDGNFEVGVRGRLEIAEFGSEDFADLDRLDFTKLGELGAETYSGDFERSLVEIGEIGLELGLDFKSPLGGMEVEGTLGAFGVSFA